MLGEAAVTEKQKGNPKGNDDKCSKHPYLCHKSERWDLSPDTKDVTGRENRKKARLSKRYSSRKQGQGQDSNQNYENEVKELKAQLAALVNASKGIKKLLLKICRSTSCTTHNPSEDISNIRKWPQW